MIINAGLARIVYLEGYPDVLSGEMLEESGIETLSYAEILRGAAGGETL
jgi:dCMP deaminase